MELYTGSEIKSQFFNSFKQSNLNRI